MFSTLNALEFHSQFNCQADCLSYLVSMKWKDGYTCRKCGCHDYTKGYTPLPVDASNAAMMKALLPTPYFTI